MENETTASGEAMAQAHQVATGNALAQQAITEAVIATLLRSFPPLAAELQTLLTVTAEEYRFRVSRAGQPAEAVFAERIAHTAMLVGALSGR